MNKLLQTLASEVKTDPAVTEPATPVSADSEVLFAQEDVAAVEGYTTACLEYSEVEAAITEAEQSAGKAEVVMAKLKDMADNGGIHPQTAQVLTFLQDFAFAPFGGAEAIGIETIGAESFQDADSRVSATTFAVESFQEGLEKVWKVIRDLIAKIVKSVDQFIKRSSVWVKRAKKRAESLSKAVKDLEGEKKESELEVGVKIQYMMVDGAITPSLPDAVSAMADVMKDAGDNKAALGAIMELGKAATDGLENMIKSSKDDNAVKAAYETYVKETGAAIMAANKAQLARFNVVTDEKDGRFGELPTKRSEGILGDKAFYAVAPTEDDVMSALDPESSSIVRDMLACELQSTNEAAIYDQDAKYGALDKDQIVAVCDGIIKICDTVEDYKDEGKAVDTLRKHLVKLGDQINDSLKDAGEGMVVAASARLAVRMFGKCVTTYQKPVVQLQQHAISCSGAHIDFCLKSMSNIVKKEAA